MTDKEFFCTVCYLVLMNGVYRKSRKYIEEKSWMLKSDNYETAFALLDCNNREKVISYYRLWGYELPPKIAKIYNKTDEYTIR